MWVDREKGPDGRGRIAVRRQLQVAFVGSKDNRHDVAIDDKSEGPYKAVQPPVFSADGARTVYAAKAADAWQVYVDGKSVGSYEQVEGVQASRAGARIAYAARIAGKWHAVVDGELSSPFDQVRADRLFSHDGRRVAFAAKADGKWFVVVDGVRQGPFREIREGVVHRGTTLNAARTSARPLTSTVLFSPDSAHIAYVARADRDWFVVRDGVPGKPYRNANVGAVTFSPDSQHLVYQALSGNGYTRTKYNTPCPDHAIFGAWTVVVDEKSTSHATKSNGRFVDRPDRGFIFDSNERFRFLAIGKDIEVVVGTVK